MRSFSKYIEWLFMAKDMYYEDHDPAQGHYGSPERQEVAKHEMFRDLSKGD
jgi:hypothetical protein